jgi:hypothetical protein
VACDQPFEEVERPEFKALLEYVYGTGPTGQRLAIPSATTVKRHIMTMGQHMEYELKEFIQVCSFQVINFPILNTL